MSTWIYGSDPRGQITSARKRLDAASGAPFAPGWDASYSYDDLGNRITWGQGSAQQTDLSDLGKKMPGTLCVKGLQLWTKVNNFLGEGVATVDATIEVNPGEWKPGGYVDVVIRPYDARYESAKTWRFSIAEL